MADEGKLPKIDPLQGRQGLHEATRHYINIIEKQNEHRVKQLLAQRRRTRYTGLSLGALVIAIYTYTIFSVKQERFLDDFEEPKFVERKVTDRKA